jgi:hypothetical protein
MKWVKTWLTLYLFRLHYITALVTPGFQLQSKATQLILRLPAVNDVATVIGFLGNKANTELDGSVSNLDTDELEAIAHKWSNLSVPPSHLNFLILKIKYLENNFRHE